MKKRILLIGYNFAPELTGIGKYSGEMIEWLANRGYECTVITAYPYYPNWFVQEPYRKHRFWYKKEYMAKENQGSITIYRCPLYVPRVPSGLQRILLEMSFFITASILMTKHLFQKKYDSVISVAPSFQLGLLGIYYKFFRGGKAIYHIQDLQIEAAQDLDMIKSKPVLKLLYHIENFIFRHSDIISTISEPMSERIAQKANKKVILFPNWADMDFFHIIEDKEELKIKFGFERNDYIILYSGGIGEKQGLDIILNAATLFGIETNVKFIICGTGPYKERLKQMAKAMSLSNVIFMPLQPAERFNEFLNMADIHLVIQKAKAGDLVMPSKLTSILAVGGVALITANEGSGLHRLVKKHEMGILVEAENQDAFYDAICKTRSGLKDKIKQNARRYSERYLSIQTVMDGFVENTFVEANTVL